MSNIETEQTNIDAVAKDRAVPGRKGIGATLLRQLPYIILFSAIIAIPRFVFKPDDTGTNYGLTVLVYVGINTILAVGLNLLMGYAGQVSLGHAAFYGLGAYVSAILTVRFSSELSTDAVPTNLIGPIAAGLAIMVATAAIVALLRLVSGKLALSVLGFAVPAVMAVRFGPKHWLPYLLAAGCCIVISKLLRVGTGKLAVAYASGAVAGFVTLAVINHTVKAGGISPWWAMVAGVLFTSLVAYLIGVQALRLHGHYLAMATLGFGIIVTIVFREWIELTGGTSGISGLPPLQVGSKPIESDLSMYYLVWIIAAIVIVLASNIVNSRVGRAFRAVHGSEIAAAAVGVDASRYKVQVFVLSAALASIAGSLYAHSTTRFVNPESFGIGFSIQLVVMVVVGGMASIWGAIFGAGAITLLGEFLRNMSPDSKASHVIHKVLGPHISVPDLDVVIFALILMLIMIFMPAGLVRGVVDGVKMMVALARRKKGVGERR